jgi:predicted ATPase
MVLIHPKTYRPPQSPSQNLRAHWYEGKRIYKKNQKDSVTWCFFEQLITSSPAATTEFIYLLSKYHTNYKVQLTQANFWIILPLLVLPTRGAVSSC